MYTHIHTYIDKEIYYKELVHALMEVRESQDLQGDLASWRPRRGVGLVLF